MLTGRFQSGLLQIFQDDLRKRRALLETRGANPEEVEELLDEYLDQLDKQY